MLLAIWNNPVLCAALVGSVFLLWWWGRYSKTLSGFKTTCVGCAIILLIGMFWDKIPDLAGLATFLSTTVLPLVFGSLVIVLIVVMLATLASRRRAAISRASRPFRRDLPKSREPRLGDQKCRYCHQRGFLYRYEVQKGRHLEIQVMCSDCAGKRDAQLSSI